jgi:Ni,Fe-hydrogenase III small subunit
MMNATSSRNDLARFGSAVFRASPRQADVTIVSGRVSRNLAPVLRRFRSIAIGCTALALVLVGCGGDGGEATLGKTPVSTTAPAVTAAPSQNLSYIATVKPAITKVDIFDSPSDEGETRTFDNPWLYDPDVPTSKVPQVFLVKQQRPDGWVQVLLPVRPNGSTGLDEDCLVVEIQDGSDGDVGQWNDVVCSDEYPFVCED